MMYAHTAHWWAQGTDDIFVGQPDPCYLPGDIDRSKAIDIGDLGIGYDQIIALDYRNVDPLEPRVVLLKYPKDVPPTPSGWPAGRWVVLAETVEEFTHMIGID